MIEEARSRQQLDIAKGSLFDQTDATSRSDNEDNHDIINLSRNMFQHRLSAANKDLL